MYFGNLKLVDIADGPGVRVTLFVSGCHIHCLGCQNKDAQSFTFGKEFTQDTLTTILKALEPDYISGFTLCGGEPFSVENQEICSHIVKEIKNKYPDKSIWAYSGYYLENIPQTDYTSDLLSNIDVLIEGPFVLSLRDISDLNRWRGSTNQRVLDMPETLKEKKKVYLKNIPNNS